jgi:DNA-binding protein H-NS
MAKITYKQMSTAVSEMPLEELMALQDEISTAVKKKQRSQQKEIYSQMRELARVAGFDSVEEFVASQSPGKRKKVAPKYCNPNDPKQTWTGRGRKPRWLADLVDGGRDLKEFEIG